MIECHAGCFGRHLQECLVCPLPDLGAGMKQISLEEVMAELEQRTARSGVEEKAARSKGTQ